MNIYWDKINETISRLRPEASAMIHQLSTHRSYSKGSYLLRQGEICRYTFYIDSGIARKFYLHEGKEITTEFYFHGDLAIALSSYSLRKPSREYIQAITDVEAALTDQEALASAKSVYPELHEFDVAVTELYAIWLEERLYQYYTQSATDRYLGLLTSYPKLIQSIPLSYIATYLGVSLETLSRIRARV